MNKVGIISALRTPIGSFNGSLSNISPVDLGAKVIKTCIEKVKIDKNIINQVIMGQVIQAGNGQDPARQSLLKAGLSENISGTTINTVCGSGLHSVGLGFDSIILGRNKCIVAGGMESMSMAPFLLEKARNGYRLGDGVLIDSLVRDGLTCPINNYHMGITAENVAIKYNINRKEQDEFAYMSQKKASEAQIKCKFKDEIIPFETIIKKEIKEIKDDENIRHDITLEKLNKLKPAFKENGTVTPGNSSGINDGAAAVLLMDEDNYNNLGIKPLVYIKGYTLIGLEPELMGLGPIKAITLLLKEHNLNLKDIDLFEINEAFAAQSIAVIKELNLDINKVNVNGGAIALGHPIGASGARILVTLIYELLRQNKKYGIASLCIGSGMGIAMLIENARL